MYNPRIRARRLSAEYGRIKKLHDSNGLFAIERTMGEPPDRYIFRYACKGIATLNNQNPVYSEEHRVALVLTDTFPISMPLMEWLTPIFHPNIRADGQAVCIGDWYQAKTLDELAIMLGEMIQYKNYASHDPLNLQASLWAMQNKSLFPVDNRSLLDPNRIAVTARSHNSVQGADDLDIVLFG
jgi:ubiquitin-protein ligase